MSRPAHFALDEPHPCSSIKTIEWDMMDKSKFIPCFTLASFSVRGLYYPWSLVRTRLQIQHHNYHYNGTVDALRKTFRHEGFGGLYRGFWVANLAMFSGIAYISTYETVRYVLKENDLHNSALRAFVGGFAASLVGQTINVPCDIVTQYLNLIGQSQANANRSQSDASIRLPLQKNKISSNSVSCDGNPLRLRLSAETTRLQLTTMILKRVHELDGFRGFYRGYVSSLCTYVPSSAIWWLTYDTLIDLGDRCIPTWLPLPALQAASAMTAGLFSALFTNPLDLMRARIQVNRTDMRTALQQLVLIEGGYGALFTKGLTARMSISIMYGLSLISVYEASKTFSLHEKYRDRIGRRSDGVCCNSAGRISDSIADMS